MTRGHRGSLLLRCRTFSCPFSRPVYPGAPQTLYQLTGWALQRGIVLEALTVDRPSLEDVYLRLTDHGAPEHVLERSPR